MRLFLIEYNRCPGRIVTLKEFSSADRRRAQDERMELELRLSRLGTEREVVLLEAANEAAVRRTHRRYFESLMELVKSARVLISGD